MADEDDNTETSELEDTIERNPAFEAMITAAISKQPVEFAQAFGDAMSSKIQELVAAKKVEIGATMFNPIPDAPEVIDEPSEEQPEDEDETAEEE